MGGEEGVPAWWSARWGGIPIPPRRMGGRCMGRGCMACMARTRGGELHVGGGAWAGSRLRGGDGGGELDCVVWSVRGAKGAEGCCMGDVRFSGCMVVV